MVRNPGRITRFVVMALLQAGRARTLGLPLHSAYSWGLNRAIFYAAAKRGFGKGSPKPGEPPGPPAPTPREVYRVGEEEAFRDPTSKELTFIIGDRAQTAEEFERSVGARFGTIAHFHQAWQEALDLMEKFDRATLESPRRFYDEVYRPRRDELSDKWSELYSPRRKPP
ncbi:MAG TPA: hypothetical protein VGS23_02585 [Thermoplasmata archaeon]|nr:hypothetical protein [Thermoplasmata archaeon]